MKVQCFSVLDKAVGAFLPVFFAPAKGAAIRSFSDAVNDPQHQFSKHVRDYALYHFGEFDDTTGLFATHEPVRVIGAEEVVNKPAPPPALQN